MFKKMLMASGTCLSSALNMLSILVWARLLEPAEYGAYALIATWGLLLNGVFFEWLRQTLARNIFDTDKTYNSSVISSIIALYFVIILIIIFMVIISQILIPSYGRIIIWVSLFGFVESGFVISYTLHTIYERPWRYFISVVGRGFLALSISIPLIQEMTRKNEAIAIAVISAGAIVTILNFTIEPALRRIKLDQISRGSILSIIHFGAPLSISATVNTLAGVADRIMVGWLLGPASLGVFTVISDIAQKPINVVMTAINTAAYASYMRIAESRGISNGFHYLNVSGRVILGATLPITMMCVFYPEEILLLLYHGGNHDYAPHVLRLIALAALLRGLIGSFYYPAFQIARKTRSILHISVVILISALSGSLIGGWLGGEIGIALGSLISAMIGLYTANRFSVRLGPIQMFSARNSVLLLPYLLWLPSLFFFDEKYTEIWTGPLCYLLFMLFSTATFFYIRLFRGENIGGNPPSK